MKLPTLLLLMLILCQPHHAHTQAAPAQTVQPKKSSYTTRFKRVYSRHKTTITVLATLMLGALLGELTYQKKHIHPAQAPESEESSDEQALTLLTTSDDSFNDSGWGESDTHDEPESAPRSGNLLLNLSNRNLRRIDTTTLSSAIVSLYAENNRLVLTPPLKQFEHLSLIDLSGNNIILLDFEKLPAALQFLYLRNNNLRGVIGRIPRLASLDLSNNPDLRIAPPILAQLEKACILLRID